MINRKFFFDRIRQKLFGQLKVSQVAGLTAILDYWEKNHSTSDDRYLAYALATAHHETDAKFQAIEEYGRGNGKKYGIADKVTKKAYYGRGLVQLTWDYNYKTMSGIFGIDFYNFPEKALELDNAVKIMFYGMIHGSFTSKKLSDYFNGKKEDWINARRIINGTDKANLIAGYAKDYYSALSYTI